jgi:hypothetical protein
MAHHLAHRARPTLAGCVLAACLAGPAPAQVIDLRDVAPADGPDDLPTPAEIIDRHIEVTGGRAAYERITSRRVEGTMDQEGQRSAITMLQRAPGHRHVRVTRSGGSEQRFITNPDESWTYEGDLVVASSGEQRVQEIRRAVFDMLLDWSAHYPLARTIGLEPVDGRPHYKVQLMAEDCHKVLLYFDAETGRNTRTVQDIAYAGDTIRADQRVDEYRSFDGVALPVRTHRTLQFRARQVVQVYEFTAVEHNVEMPDALFRTPPELGGDHAPEKAAGD